MACRCQRLNQRRIKGHRSLRPNRQMVAVPEQGRVEFVWKGVLKSQADLVETAPASLGRLRIWSAQLLYASRTSIWFTSSH